MSKSECDVVVIINNNTYERVWYHFSFHAHAVVAVVS